MKYLALLLIFGFGLSGFGQTIKSLGYNTTNGQVVANTGTLTFTNGTVVFSDAAYTPDLGADNLTVEGAIYFTEALTNVAVTRTNLGLGWSALTNSNAATSLLGFTTNGQVVANTGTNVLTFTNTVNLATIGATTGDLGIVADNVLIEGAIEFSGGTNALFFAATTRTNLGVAPAPIFKVLTNNFSITNQTNMTVVDGLTITTEAGKAYVVELFPIVSAGSGSTSLQIVASNATVYGNWDGTGISSYSTNKLTNAFSFTVTDSRVLVQKFYVASNTNAGSIAFQFSSTTSSNTNTIGAGSYMMAQEVTPTP